MSVKTLKTMLEKIEDGKGINIDIFRKLVQKLRLRHRYRPTDIQGMKQKGTVAKYIITFIEPNLFKELMLYIEQSGSDRISAAKQNLSHNHNVIGSFLILIEAASVKSEIKGSPIVVTFDGEGKAIYPVSTDINGYTVNNKRQAKDALLIENRQLLLRWDEVVTFLQVNTDFNSQDFDIIYGAGNEVSNSLHKDFLSKYNKLYFCFDIDLGGLTIARNIINAVPDTECEFLIPKDIDDRLSQVVNHSKTSDINQVRVLAADYKQLAMVGSTISRHFKTIEQESFLYA